VKKAVGGETCSSVSMITKSGMQILSQYLKLHEFMGIEWNLKMVFRRRPCEKRWGIDPSGRRHIILANYFIWAGRKESACVQ